MNVLIPYFAIEGTSSFPDDYTLFADLQVVTMEGVKYYLCNYTGSKNLQTGATYADYLAWKAIQPRDTGITCISTRAWFTRFTSAERIDLRNKAAGIGENLPDYELVDILEEFNMASFVELKDPRVEGALYIMLAKGVLLEESRIATLLEDGAEYEAYSS